MSGRRRPRTAGAEGERHNVQLSKGLSWLLRHNMLNQGLKPTKDGFVDVDEVLKLPR